MTFNYLGTRIYDTSRKTSFDFAKRVRQVLSNAEFLSMPTASIRGGKDEAPIDERNEETGGRRYVRGAKTAAVTSRIFAWVFLFLQTVRYSENSARRVLMKNIRHWSIS